MKRCSISLLAFSLLFEVCTAAPQFRTVAKTGGKIVGQDDFRIASFGHWVSINDAGQVAFKAKLQNGTELIVRADPNTKDPNDPNYGQYDPNDATLTTIVETADGSINSFGDYVGINSKGSTSYRRKKSGGGVVFDILRDTTRVAHGTSNDEDNWYFRGIMAPTDISSEGEGMVSFQGTVLEGYKTYTQIRKNDNSTFICHYGGKEDTFLVATQTLPTQAGFTSLNQFTSINDAGYVVFTGKHPEHGDGIFVGQGDDWETVGDFKVVAKRTGTAQCFQTVGQKPSINNLDRVAFYGADADPSQKPGIYIWEAGTVQRVFETVSPVESIEPDSRIGFNDLGDVAFMGTDDAGQRALFAGFKFTTLPQVIVKVGDLVDGSNPIDAIEFWDGMNNYRDLAFWVRHTDGTESVLVVPSFQVIVVKREKKDRRLRDDAPFQGNTYWGWVSIFEGKLLYRDNRGSFRPNTCWERQDVIPAKAYIGERRRDRHSSTGHPEGIHLIDAYPGTKVSWIWIHYGKDPNWSTGCIVFESFYSLYDITKSFEHPEGGEGDKHEPDSTFIDHPTVPIQVQNAFGDLTPSQYSVSGTVRDAYQKPVKEVNVKLQREDGSDAATPENSNSDGHFDFLDVNAIPGKKLVVCPEKAGWKFRGVRKDSTSQKETYLPWLPIEFVAKHIIIFGWPPDIYGVDFVGSDVPTEIGMGVGMCSTIPPNKIKVDVALVNYGFQDAKAKINSAQLKGRAAYALPGEGSIPGFGGQWALSFEFKNEDNYYISTEHTMLDVVVELTSPKALLTPNRAVTIP